VQVQGSSFDFTAGTLPVGAALTRASIGWAFGSTGVLTSFAIDVPRFNYDPSTLALQGLLNEPAQINSNPNANAGGGTSASPGVTPTSWVCSSNSNGLVRTLTVGVTETGIPAVDFRFAGTPTASNSLILRPVAVSTIVAAPGEIWRWAYNYRLTAGTLANTTIRSLETFRTSGGATINSQIMTVVPTSAALRTQRVEGSQTALATTAFVDSDFRIDYTTGQAIDLTIRLGMPQLSKTVLGSPIISTAGALGRSADVLTLTVPNGTYDVYIQRLSGITIVPNVVVSAGTYVVPTDTSPLISVLALDVARRPFPGLATPIT
jgi:hypothetical protein